MTHCYGSHKKKRVKFWTMTEALMTPPQGVIDIKGLDAQNGVPPSTTKVCTFWYKKYENTKSIFDMIQIIEKNCYFYK